MGKNIQVVVFCISKEFYSVPIAAVQEIVRVPEVTAYRSTPSSRTRSVSWRT